MSLEKAIMFFLNENKIEFINLVRKGQLGANLSVRYKEKYYVIHASVNAKSEIERENFLYKEFVRILIDSLQLSATEFHTMKIIRCTNCKTGEIEPLTLICGVCKTTYTKLEIENIQNHLLQQKADKLGCTPELVKYIEGLEEELRIIKHKL